MLSTRTRTQRTRSILIKRWGYTKYLLFPCACAVLRATASLAWRASARPHACACSTGTTATARGEGAGPPQYACALRGRVSRRRGRAGAQGVPAPEHKQERARDEAAVDPPAASCGQRGGERGQAPTLSAPDSPSRARALSRARPPRAHHEPGESERRGRRRPAALRQLQPGQHVRPAGDRGPRPGAARGSGPGLGSGRAGA